MSRKVGKTEGRIQKLETRRKVGSRERRIWKLELRERFDKEK